MAEKYILGPLTPLVGEWKGNVGVGIYPTVMMMI